MINIREDYRFYTHLPGKESVIPMAKAWLKAYPCLLEIFIEDDCQKVEIFHEEISSFTHLLNIEKRRVEIFGRSTLGYFHVFIFARKGEVVLKLHRGKLLPIAVSEKKFELKKHDEIVLCKTGTKDEIVDREKVAFGSFKKPLLEKGIDLQTRLYYLSQDMPDMNPVELSSDLINALLVDLMSPKNVDEYHQGLKFPAQSFDRFALFSSFKKLFKNQLMLEQDDQVTLLPKGNDLPVCGRANNVQGKGFSIDILWKKSKVQRAVIYPKCDGKKVFALGAKYRVKMDPKEKGVFVSRDEPLEMKKGQKIFIDRVTL